MPSLLEVEDHIGDKDFAPHRTWKLDNGNKIHFVKHDPYGFWTVNYDKGPLPTRLTGQYTSFPEAEKAVLAYLTTVDKSVVEVEDTISIQPDTATVKKGKWQQRANQGIA